MPGPHEICRQKVHWSSFVLTDVAGGYATEAGKRGFSLRSVLRGGVRGTGTRPRLLGLMDPDTSRSPDLLSVLGRRWPLVLAAMLIAAAGAFGVSRLQQKRY